jgi:hypothetical protein
MCINWWWRWCTLWITENWTPKMWKERRDNQKWILISEDVCECVAYDARKGGKREKEAGITEHHERLRN